MLGIVLADLKRFSEAERELLEAQRVLSSAKGVRPDSLKDCIEALGSLYTEWNKAEPGKGHDAKSAEWKAKLEAIKPAAPELKPAVNK